jgi:nitric oxide reductase large subunit
MESVKIDYLVEKYFQGETSIAEEKELRTYFSSSDVAAFRTIQAYFEYFSLAKEQQFTSQVPQLPKAGNIKRNATWLSLAASVVVLLGIGTYVYHNYDDATNSQNLGTYDDPEEAFRATQKALSLLSSNVNVGIESVQYIQVYQPTKTRFY